MSIYAYLEYRHFLAEEIKKRKKTGLGVTQAELAKACGMQNTYLTNVLKGRGHFNSDQIYALASNLKLSEEETNYLFLLKEYEQSASAERKEKLKRQLDAFKQQALKSEKYISAKPPADEQALLMKYYGDPMNKIVHLLLQIPRYTENYSRAAIDLNIQKKYLQKILETLIELKMIEFKDDKTALVLKKNFHLPKESLMLLPHQLLMRQKAAQRLLEVPIDKRYSFSVTFSATEEVRRSIQQKFLEFLKDIEQLVKEAESENAYQINFDLFPWND
jgi:uncharacterized protein (TIGR02147 family)